MHQLVSPAYQLQVVVADELSSHFGSKQPPSTPGGHCPVVHLLWVRPDQVTERPLVRNLLVPLYQSDLVKRPDIWR